MDNDTVARVRAALDESPRISAERIEVSARGDAVVLSGAVASPEDATVAGSLAGDHAGDVRNELRVDEHLREQPGSGGDEPFGYAPEQPGEDRDHRGIGVPDSPDVGMVRDTEHALGESEPWDPPDAPHLAPTVAEQRGATDRDITVPDPADTGTGVPPDPDPGTAEPSAPDLSAEELARSVRDRTAPSDSSADRRDDSR